MYYSLINSMNKTVASNPLWDNLVAYYTGDNTPNDAKGTYNGTLVNGATYGAGKINNGFSLDGVNDYVETPTTTINTSLAHSYSLWIKPTTVNTYSMYMSSIESTSDGFSIGHDNAGNLGMFRGWINAQNLSGYYLTANTTYHISVVYKGASFGVNNLLFYVNGALVSTKSANIVFTTYKPLIIGANGLTNSGFYKGIIDEAAVWNRVLSATEVTELYNSGSGKQYPL